MKAVVIERAGGPEVLAVAERPDPVPDLGEIVVRVRASAMNRADLLQRAGHYPAPRGVPADIPGLELAGDVVARGEGATRFPLGARVFGLVAGGAHASRVLVHQDAIAPMPENMSYEDAAAIPEAFLTAYDALVLQAHLTRGETVLVHAAASGVGTAALQIGRAYGATVLGTTRTASKLAAIAQYGLTAGHVVAAEPSARPTFAQWVRDQTKTVGANVILDLVGGAYLPENVLAAARKGRIMCVGLVGGSKVEIDFGRVLAQRLTLRGTVMRSRGLEEKIAAARVLERELVPMFARGELTTVVHARMPLFEPQRAHEALEKSDAIGKLVLVSDEGTTS